MSAQPRCLWCSRQIHNDSTLGRRRRYCSQACRQRAYEKRHQQSGSGGVGPDDVVVRRTELESLQDRLYALRSAVEVLESAVADKADAAEMRSVAREVVAAAGDLDRLWVSP